MAKIYNFDTWDQNVNEGLWNSFKNALSRFFGGAVSKIDKILKEYRENSEEYWERWADARDKIVSANTMLAGIRDPLQRERYREELTRAERLMKQVESTKDDINKSLAKQGNILTNGSDRLKDYWDLEKAKAEHDIAKEAYEKVKHITDDEDVEKLYSEIAKKLEAAKAREKDFTEKYGHIDNWTNYMRRDHSQYTNDIKKAEDNFIKKEEADKKETQKEAPKEELKAPKEEAPVDKTNIEEFFDEARKAIEANIGADIDDDQYKALRADMVKIYLDVRPRYINNLHSVRNALIAFAGEVYERKDKAHMLKKTLDDKEIREEGKKFDEYYK